MVKQSGDTRFNRDKMMAELIKINDTTLDAVVPDKRNKLTTEEYNAAPKNVQQLEARQKELYKMNGKDAATLAAWYDEAVRKHGAKNEDLLNAFLLERGSEEMVHVILERRDEIDFIQEQLSYFVKNKKLPDDVAFEKSLEADPVALQQQLDNLRSRISKEKKKLPASAEKLKQLEQERDVLERRLDGFV